MCRAILSARRARLLSHEYRITLKHIAAHRASLQPGDVVLERRNGKMSNTGIPGFWTHVALHTGTAEELDAFFAGLPILAGQSPLEHLQAVLPDAHRALTSRDEAGHAHALIEALEPGIIFTSCEYSLNADYVGVIRPRLSKEDLFQALLRAFNHLGKPYDFNFDFATDDKLVCSELVYKALVGLPGMSMAPAIVNGRLLMKPNALATSDKSHAHNSAP